MAKFCNKCGKELENGICVHCNKEETNHVEKIEENKEESRLNMEDVKNTVNNFKNSPTTQKVIKYYKNALINPIKVVKEEFCGLTAKLNWLICLLNSVIIGIMTIIFFKINLNEFIETMKSIERSTIGYSSLNNLDVDLPYFKILLFIAVISIVSNIIIVILEKIFFGLFCRSKVKMSKYFSTQMLLYTIFTIAYTVAIICSFISIKLYFVILTFGLVMDIVILVQLSIDEKTTKKNILAIVTPIYVVISVIAVMAVWIIGLSLVMHNYNSSPALITDRNILENQSRESSGYNFDW